MPRKPLTSAAWLTTLILAIPYAYADNTASLDEWPDWVHDSMKKESRRLKYREVATPDNSVRTKLPGKPAEPQAIEDGWYYTTELKPDVLIECYLLTSGRDLATFTNAVAEANIDAMGSRYGTVDNRRVFHTDAGEIGGNPYLALEWLYTVEADSQVLVGFTKVRAAGKGDKAYACASNSIGYRETFSKVFAEFVNNAEVADPEPEPFYEEIARLNVNGIGPGIIYIAYSIDEDGDIRSEQADGSIFPVSPSTIMASDSYSISYSDPEGGMNNAFSITVENGEITSNMSLERNDADDWISGGTLQGKELSYEIDGTLNPVSEWHQLALARDLFAGEEQATSMLVWVPEADPTRFITAGMTRDDTDVERQAQLTIGPLQMTGQFDEFGNLVTGDMVVGPAQMRVERIWSRGSLPE